jgi:hypothetical protein
MCIIVLQVKLGSREESEMKKALMTMFLSLALMVTVGSFTAGKIVVSPPANSAPIVKNVADPGY